MAGEQRKCANCRYFHDAGMAGNGWCTHPKRRHNSDVKILVRAGELACRNSWGGDLFQGKSDTGQSATDAGADLPGRYDQPDASRDDEVTSVVTPPDRLPTPTHSTDEDRVVSDRPAPRRDDEDDSRNDAARQDQDERARIMARGSRDAIMRARERHTHRRSRSTGSDDDSGEHDLAAGTADRVVAHQARFSDRFVKPRHTAGILLDDGGPVPRAEVERRFFTPSDRFDSIPEVDPSFDLPGWHNRAVEQAEPDFVADADDRNDNDDGDSPERLSGQDQPVDHITSYEHILQRARRIRESKSQQAARPVRHSRFHTRREHSQPDELESEDPAEPTHAIAGDDFPDLIEHDDLAAEPDALIHDVEDDLAAMVDTYETDLEDTWFEESELPDEAPEERPGRRTGGWLSHFGLRRRHRSAAHDDATITRHAEAREYRSADTDEVANTAGMSWSHDEEQAGEHPIADDWSPGWEDTAGEDDRSQETFYTASAGVDVEQDEYSHENPDISSYVPDHEPDDAFGTTLGDELANTPRSATATYAARPRTEPWHRQRPTRELPDLDDNLFEETFERARPSSPADALDRAPVPDEPLAAMQPAATATMSGSPRDSFFRAARFEDWNEQLSDEAMLAGIEDDYERAAATDGSLPDLDEHSLNLREVVARGGELIDMTIDISPDIPRECRTCRSFRSADGGARGWCTNEWAFTHRRMVNEENLACETTIGCWWLPADRYWLIEDESGYASPTPRMDELIAREISSPARKVSGD